MFYNTYGCEFGSLLPLKLNYSLCKGFHPQTLEKVALRAESITEFTDFCQDI